MNEKEEICISNMKTIADIKAIQKYVKTKGEDVNEEAIVQACINLAR